jgi:hypothetical protein
MTPPEARSLSPSESASAWIGVKNDAPAKFKLPGTFITDWLKFDLPSNGPLPVAK